MEGAPIWDFDSDDEDLDIDVGDEEDDLFFDRKDLETELTTKSDEQVIPRQTK
jgi:hypothetical protein